MVYPDADEALKAVLDNDSIAKLVSYDDMLRAARDQSLAPLSEGVDLKYPFIQIEWSENDILNRESRLSLSDAKRLIDAVAEDNLDDDTVEKTRFSLFLDNRNTYSFNMFLGDDYVEGFIDHIKQHLNELQGEISGADQLEYLRQYLHNNGFLEPEVAVNQHQQLDLFSITEIE